MGSTVFPAPASGPTLAEITTAIQTNASPFGGTWTSIYANAPGTGVGTLTVSGLGSYKYLRVRWSAVGGSSAGQNLWVRFNGDSGTNYFDHRLYSNGTSPATSGSALVLGSQFNFRRCDSNATENNNGGFEIWGSNSSTIKHLSTQEHIFFDGSQMNPLHTATSIYQVAAAITSITFTLPAGNFTANSKFFIDGGI